MEEMIVLPKKEVPEVVQWYKGQLTGNALLERAGRLAAQKKRLLADPTLDAAEALQQVRPVSQALRAATKRLRQFPVAGVGESPVDDEDDDQDLVSSAVEKWMKRLVQGPRVKPEPRTPLKKKPPLPPKPEPRTPKPDPDLLASFQSGKLPITKPKRTLPPTPPSTRSARPKTTTQAKQKKKGWTSAAWEGSLQGIKDAVTPRAVKRLKPASGWEDFEQPKLRRDLTRRDY